MSKRDKMILHRFMSRAEYDKYKAGEVLRNDTDHYREGKGGATSRGFCFFTGPVNEWAHRLNGLVTFDVLLTVEFSGENLDADVYVSIGRYCDNPMAAYPQARLYREVCTTAYSRASMRLVSADFSYGMNPWFHSRAEAQEVIREAELLARQQGLDIMYNHKNRERQWK